MPSHEPEVVGGVSPGAAPVPEMSQRGSRATIKICLQVAPFLEILVESRQRVVKDLLVEQAAKRREPDRINQFDATVVSDE